MESLRHAGGTVLFGKPYRWVHDADGTLSLWPTLKPNQPHPPDAPFTSDLIRDATRRLRS